MYLVLTTGTYLLQCGLESGPTSLPRSPRSLHATQPSRATTLESTHAAAAKLNPHRQEKSIDTIMAKATTHSRADRSEGGFQHWAMALYVDT